MGKCGEVINVFILPLLYGSLAATFFFSFVFLGYGGYLMVGQDDAASGAAMALFIMGCCLMYISAFGLIGLLKESSIILNLVGLLLCGMLVALFGLMTVCFVLGFEMPSIRDIVVRSWQEGCASTADTAGCLQAELAGNNWCYDNVLPADKSYCVNAAGEPDAASQKLHHCSVACQSMWIEKSEDHMGDMAIGCFVALCVLLVTTVWNSQTHHGCWCITASHNEDDDENTVQSIPPGMAYPAYVLNGVLSLAGIAMAVMAVAVLADATTFTGVVVILLGVGYFAFGASAIFAVATNHHWLLRISNIVYLGTCPILVVVSLVGMVYSGQIENVFDFYDDHWCKIRNQLEQVDKDYCAGLSDPACKQKIVDDSTEDMDILGAVVLISIGAVTALIWFSLRLARKFKFNDRGFKDSAETYDDDEDEDEKGGDDEAGVKQYVVYGLLAVPTVCCLVAIILVATVDGNHDEEAVTCGSLSAEAIFNGTAANGALLIKGTTRFTHLKPDITNKLQVTQPNIEVEIVFTHTKQKDSDYDFFEVFEFPVGTDGDCSKLGSNYPSGAKEIKLAPKLKVEVGSKAPFTTQYGITNAAEYIDISKQNKHSLFGEKSIIGRSVKACKTADCAKTEDPRPQCATIAMTGVTPTTVTVPFNISGVPLTGKAIFTQMTKVRDETDTTVYLELESTDDSKWDLNEEFLLHIQTRQLPAGNRQATVATCTAAGNVTVPLQDNQGKYGDVTKCKNSGYANKMQYCKTGDLSAKFGKVKVGKKGAPFQKFMVDSFWRSDDPLSKTSSPDGGLLLRGKSSGIKGVADNTHTLVLKKANGKVVGCAGIPSWLDGGKFDKATSG